MARTYSLRRWYFLIPAILIAVGVFLPIGYLIFRAASTDPAELVRLIFRKKTAVLFWNTLGLSAGVLFTTSVIGFALAWISVRTRLINSKLIIALGVLPLGIPGYVMAYLLLGMTGDYGILSRSLGISLPVLSGYFGSLVALTFNTFPYVFLNLRSALLGLDESIEESGRALGLSRKEVFRRVTLHQLRPAFLAAALVVVLHVIGDFGVVSLMRFETFSYSIYIQYAAAFDRAYASCLALILLALTAVVLFAEFRLLKGQLYHRTWSTARPLRGQSLGRFRIPSIVLIILLGVFAIIVPIITLVIWAGRAVAEDWSSALISLVSSASASFPAALLSVIIATPIVLISVRRPTGLHRALERTAYLGYAMPPLALALALIFLSLHSLPGLYQTFGLLIIAYVIHFVAEAIGPIRSTLYQVPERLEEASVSLGRKPLDAFLTVTLPLIRKGIVVGGALVFLSAMKELPLTLLLAPLGFETLATNVWTFASEAQFTRAAPYALFIVLFSLLLSYVILANSRSTGRRAVK